MRFGQRSQRLLSHMNYTITEKVIGLNLWKESDGFGALTMNAPPRGFCYQRNLISPERPRTP